MATAANLTGGVPPEGRGWVERHSERIAHSEAYLRYVIATTPGLELRSLSEVTIRNEGRKPLQGHLCVVRKFSEADDDEAGASACDGLGGGSEAGEKAVAELE